MCRSRGSNDLRCAASCDLHGYSSYGWYLANVVTLGAQRAVPVIVASRLLDNPLCIDVLEPPFREVNIDFVLKCALLRVG